MDAAAASRFMQRYAKAYHGGAFAMPTAKDLAASGWREWGDGDDLAVAVDRTLTRPSRRRDWSGVDYELPAGTRLVTHIATTPGFWPDLAEFDLVYAYRDDLGLSAALEAQGRVPWATAITAASEIVCAWGHGGGLDYEPVDLLTVERLPQEIGEESVAEMLAEVAGLAGWDDDYPYYSDGSWSALSLRGFRPDDPTWGVKPSEMNRKWQIAHPDALGYECGWTVLSDLCPTIMWFLDCRAFAGKYERVRLLRMGGAGSLARGKGGILRRHTDITDRASGTRDGQIVRFHIPLQTDPKATMTVWDLDGTSRTLHLPAGSCWYLDARKPHAVTNASDRDRIHLVADVICDADVRAILLEAACNSRI